jgi:hypothetical protein
LGICSERERTLSQVKHLANYGDHFVLQIQFLPSLCGMPRFEWQSGGL